MRFLRASGLFRTPGRMTPCSAVRVFQSWQGDYQGLRWCGRGCLFGMQSWVPAQWLRNSSSGRQREPNRVVDETFGLRAGRLLEATESYSSRLLY